MLGCRETGKLEGCHGILPVCQNVTAYYRKVAGFTLILADSVSSYQSKGGVSNVTFYDDSNHNTGT